MKRKTETKDKECRPKKSNTKRAMDEKNKKNNHRIVPHTERNASGRNWEIFKNTVFNSVSLESDVCSKENAKKKTVPYHQKSKNEHKFILSSNSMPQLNEKEVPSENKTLTKQVAMDCEMVGIGDGTESMIARVSIVNRHGSCIYDKYVKPREPVQDYRTKVSGIRPHNLQTGEQFEVVQKEVAEILRGRILVGHALKHDLDVLYLSHPRKHLRDTSRFKTFRQLSRGNTPSLKKLAYELLGREIQTGEHSSVEDAKAAMQLYVLYRNKWESESYSKQRIK
ncbi:RNA exonuclease 4 isoform X2 [Colletes gigas]|uniref:RNA exonuclease 4 isoform X2 n=1 Tax=Colletes gigas TaxID=935657 RepID=UPI001C9A31D2|nr:RNA exonuclease 4 isoform X2 [Colletes gigas]